MTQDIYTEDLGEIMSKYCERNQVLAILKAWHEGEGLPPFFDEANIRFAFNRNSGNVFLVNDEYQVAMLDSTNNLSEFYSTPYQGHEGFLEDFLAEKPSHFHAEDREYILNIAIDRGHKLPRAWRALANKQESK